MFSFNGIFFCQLATVPWQRLIPPADRTRLLFTNFVTRRRKATSSKHIAKYCGTSFFHWSHTL